jgi:hypothetical protein
MSFEGFGQLAKLVLASDLDPVVVVAGLQLQHALMHVGHRSHRVLGHPPTKVDGDSRRRRKKRNERKNENCLKVSAVGEPLIHRFV